MSVVTSEADVHLDHGRILYLEDVSVSFDGFKAINKLSLDIAPSSRSRRPAAGLAAALPAPAQRA